jgi:hypothetical protein
MNLLITYIHDLKIQIITTPPLIFKIHKSPYYTLSLFQRAVFSEALPWQRLVTVEVLQLHALTPFPAGHRLATELNIN